MEVLEVIKKRRSIRRYKRVEIEEEKLRKILEAARLAPSARNLQPWHFVVVKDPKLKEELAKAAAHQMFIADAAVIIVALSNPQVSPRWHDKDTMIAIEHMVLEATELGLGTCWIGAFDENKVKEIIGAPDYYKVVALLPIGVPDESPPPRPRKTIEEIVSLNKFGNKYKL